MAVGTRKANVILVGCLSVGVTLSIAPAFAQVAGGAQEQQQRQQQELLRQQERERVLRQQQEVRPDVRLDREREVPSLRLPAGETPCFVIDHIDLQGELASEFEWALTAANPAEETHFIRYSGRYNASVVADPEWLAARRHLLRRLVESLQIRPVTQEEIEAARAAYVRRRAIDRKCGSDRKCREREEAAAWS